MDGNPLEWLRLLLQNPDLIKQGMQQSQAISDAVPRTPDALMGLMAPSARSLLPELPINYRPPERYNYGQPVRLGALDGMFANKQTG